MNLQKQKQQLEDRLKEISIEQNNLDKIQDRDIKVFVIDLLKSHNIIQEGDVVDAYRTRIDIKRSHPGYSYDKDMFTIYHDAMSWEGDSGYKTEINYYTGGSTNDKWELNRLVSLGRMAEFLVVESNYNKITDGIAKIKSIHGSIAEPFYKERFEIEKQLREIEKEEIDFLHYDVIDGNFAPDFTMGSSTIELFRSNSKLKSDYHLMVEEPSRIFDMFEAEEEAVLYIHQECCRNLHRDLIKIRQKGLKVGVALCPATPLETLEYIIEDVDVVLLMTVNPGYKGQPLVPQTIKKIANLKEIIKNMELSTKIAVDGNVNKENIPQMVAAGGDILVLGSSGLFRKDKSISDCVKDIKEAIDEGYKLKENNNV